MDHDESTTPSPRPEVVVPASVAPSPSVLPSVSSGRVWAFALAAGILSGALSAGVQEATFQTFPAKLTPETVNGITTMVATLENTAYATRKNAPLTFGLVGGLLGLALGLAGGLARRDRGSAITAALIGLVAGALVTATATWSIVLEYYRYAINLESSLDESLFLPLMVHIGMWAPAGAVGGLALAVGLFGRRDRTMILRGVLGGLFGAALGALAYEILGGIAFPMAKTPQPFAEDWMARGMAMMLVCTFAATGAAFAINDAARGRGPAA